MTALIGLALFAALICWAARAPSEAIFEDAMTYYAAAERWQRRLVSPGDNAPAAYLAEMRDACLARGAELTRKALRRMPWRLL